MNSTKLKPCPFCGAYPNLHLDKYEEMWYVSCDNNKCKILPITCLHPNKSFVIRQWNKRSDK